MRMVLCAVLALLAGEMWGTNFKWNEPEPSTYDGKSVYLWTNYKNWQYQTALSTWSDISASSADYPGYNNNVNSAIVYLNTDDNSSENIIIYITENVRISDLYIESDTGKSVTLVVADGVTLTVNGTLTLGHQTGSSGEEVNLVITGGGTVTANTIRYTNTSTSSSVTITNGSSLTATSLQANTNSGTVYVTGDGTGTFAVSATNEKITVDSDSVNTDSSNYYFVYDANGGTLKSEYAKTQVTKGQALTLTLASVLEVKNGSLSFLGWATTASATSAEYADGESFTPTRSMTFYAVWDAPVAVSTYYWTGKSENNATDWQDSTNWAPNADGTGTIIRGDYPGSKDGDTAVFSTNVSGLTNFQVASTTEEWTITLRTTASTTDAYKGVQITGTNHHKENIVLQSTAADGTGGFWLMMGADSQIGSIRLESGNLRLQTGGLQIDGSLQIESGCTAVAYNSFSVNASTTNSGTVTYWATGNHTFTFNDDVTNDGVLGFASGSPTLTFNGNFTAGSSSSFTATSGNTLFYGDTDFSAMSAANFNANGGTVYFIADGKMLSTCAGQELNVLCVGGSGTTLDISEGNVKISALILGTANTSVVPLRAESSSVEISGGNTITCSEKLELYRLSNTDGVTGSLTANCNITTALLYMHSGTHFTVGEGYTTTPASFTDISTSALANSLTVNGTLDRTGKSIAFSANTALVTGTNGTVTAADITNGSGNTNSITNAGTLNASGTVTGSASITNSGTLMASGLSSIGSLTNQGGGTIIATAVSTVASLVNAGTLNADTISGVTTLTNTGTASAAASLEAGTVTNSGTLNTATNFTVTKITGSGTENFTGTGIVTITNSTESTLGQVNVTAEADTTFESDLTITENLNIAGKARFNGNLDVAKKIMLSGSKDVRFNGGHGISLTTTANSFDCTMTGGTLSLGTTTDNVESRLDFFTIAQGGINIPQEVAVNLSGTVTTTDGSAQTYNGTVTLTSQARVQTGADGTGSGGITFGGTLGCTDSKSFALSLATGGTASFKGDVGCGTDNMPSSLDIQAADITLENNAVVKAASLSASGTQESLTALTGSGTLVIPGGTEKADVQYLSIGNGIKITADSADPTNITAGTFNTKGSSPATGSTVAELFNNGWKLSGMTFIWCGTTSDAWEEASNWNVGIVPGEASTQDAQVVIPQVADGLSYPVSSSAYTVAKLSVGSQTAPSATLTVAGTQNITLTEDDPLIIHGTVIFADEGRITDSTGTPINDPEHSGTIEYTDNAITVTDFGETDYSNLIISATVAYSGDSLYIADNLSISSEAVFSATGSAGVISVAGDWNNKGSFSGGSSTVTFVGENESNILGNNAFYNFSCTAADKVLVFEDGSEQTVTGTFVIQGALNHPVILKSGSNDIDNAWWVLKAASASVSYVVVSCSVAEPDISASVTNATEGIADSTQGWIVKSAEFPDFYMVLSPVGQNEVHIFFDDNLETDSQKNKFYLSVSTASSIESLFAECFKIITISADGSATNSGRLEVNTAIPAKISRITSGTDGSIFTHVTLTLNADISYTDLLNTFVQQSAPIVQDAQGNCMPQNHAHALSDFAINAVEPLYAYSSETGAKNSWAVHDWNAQQSTFGTLPYGHGAEIVSEIQAGSGIADADSTSLPENLILFLAAATDNHSYASAINENLNQDYRIWLPALSDFSFAAFTDTFMADGSYKRFSAENDDGQTVHSIPGSELGEFMPAEQLSFLFAFSDSAGDIIKITTAPNYNQSTGTYDLPSARQIPLFGVRLLDSSDILSLDLWSFRLKNVQAQRGGVTILNNVINATRGEKVTLQVSMAAGGSLNIMVMTADGNIVDYLNRDTATSGTHYFTWDGRNRNGNAVARGMYFIRIIGSGIDETRKVMVVK